MKRMWHLNGGTGGSRLSTGMCWLWLILAQVSLRDACKVGLVEALDYDFWIGGLLARITYVEDELIADDDALVVL